MDCTILLVCEGTLRSRTTPSEENQAVADLSLGISPRLAFRRFSALGLDLKKIGLSAQTDLELEGGVEGKL